MLKRIVKRWKLLVLGLGILVAIVLILCNRDNQKQEITTLRFLLFGEEPEGMQAVLDEFYQRTKDTLGIKIEMDWIGVSSTYKVESEVKLSSQESYDLVFDAPWIHMNMMQERGIYADLAEYFDNPNYPGLYNSFAKELLQNSLVNGQQCAIPILRTYGSGISCIFYRKDLAQKYGIHEIEDLTDLERYMEQIQRNEKDMIPLLLQGNRGSYSFYPQSYQMTEEQSRQIAYPIRIGGVSVVAQLNEELTRVEAIAMMGDSEEAFSHFMEGLQFDFLIDRVDGYRAWRKYCEADSLNQTDQLGMFQKGKGSAYITTLDDYEKVSAELAQNIEGAEIGIYFFNEGVRNLQPKSLNVNMTANNFLLVPKYSPNIDKTMAFLDWLFASKDNHDLFEYGIEGVHWKAVGEGQYEVIPDENGNTYMFPGYSLTWNPNYVRFPADMPEEVLKYKQYELLESSFYKGMWKDFTFDDSKVQNQSVRVEDILTEAWIPIRHGMVDNPREVLQDAVAEAKEVGLYDIYEELQIQIQAYLDKVNQQNKENFEN